ncbi:TPA: hypothetical protein H1012_00535 [archaeon]|nr:hypothetical protein [Candidatus Naiadarchaeales archaeon SRR2090153.bin461]HIK02317.1 hypothetical protein [Candidatus Naiadarchaeales archaeon SRR2090159.bin1288]
MEFQIPAKSGRASKQFGKGYVHCMKCYGTNFEKKGLIFKSVVCASCKRPLRSGVGGATHIGIDDIRAKRRKGKHL